MKVAVFNAKPYDKTYFNTLNTAEGGHGHELTYLEARLTPETAGLVSGHQAACVFVHAQVTRQVLETFAQLGCKLVALRCAGFNNVDLAAAKQLGITIARVPAYSPHGVAEFAASLILGLNRKIHRANRRIKEFNFSLDGLVGFDLYGKTVGVIGTGKIGACFVRIMRGFGCKVLCFDTQPNDEVTAMGAEYLPLEDVLAQADIISLHCPLTPQTHHLINETTLGKMKPGVMLINTSRGELVHTTHAIAALKSGHVGYMGIDVYEEEEGVFFEDFSARIIQDDVLSRLMTFPNVLITSHQAFFTDEALKNIAETTLGNISEFAQTGKCTNAVE